MDDNFDLIILGGGPGGYTAAIRAAQLKMKVALVEANQLGGICLNWGCIPTKALLKSAEISTLLDHLPDYGFAAIAKKPDFAKIVSRSRAVAERLSKGVKHLMKKNQITLFDNFGKLNGAKQVRLFKDDKFVKDISAKNIIIATGARAKKLPNFPEHKEIIWSYKEAMTAAQLPKTLLVVGSGAIGMEFASFYHALGSKVTVVELKERILPNEDQEISQLAQKHFTKIGLEIHCQSQISQAQIKADQLAVKLEDASGKAVERVFDKAIIAVGVTGNLENIGLSGTKVEVKNGNLVTDQFCQTAEPNLYAIGDVAGLPWLAHKASHEGILAVEHMAGLKVHPLKASHIPACTYTSPQIASIGLSEEQARDQYGNIKVGRYPYLANGKAIAAKQDEVGLIKTIFDAASGELLGAHMIGAEVTELIQGFAIAIKLEATEESLKGVVFPHPTLSEMMHEAVLDASDEAINF